MKDSPYHLNPQQDTILTRYHSHLQAKGYKPRTQGEILRTLKRFFTHLNANDIHYIQFLPKQALAYQATLSQDFHLSPSSINKEITILNTFYTYLIQKNTIFKNPFRILKPIKIAQTLKKNILTIPQMSTLLQNIKVTSLDNLKFKASIEILYATGMRVSELEGLSTQDINLEDKTVYIKDDKARQFRYIPLTRRGVHYLSIYLNSIDRTEYPFRQGKKRTYSRQLNVLLKRLCQDLSLPIITCHSIRHSLATHLLAKGMSLVQIQNLLGHKKISTTTRYTHPDENRINKQIIKYHPRII